MEIALRGRQARMAKEHLHGSEIRPAIEQMGGERVP